MAKGTICPGLKAGAIGILVERALAKISTCTVREEPACRHWQAKPTTRAVSVEYALLDVRKLILKLLYTLANRGYQSSLHIGRREWILRIRLTPPISNLMKEKLVISAPAKGHYSSFNPITRISSVCSRVPFHSLMVISRILICSCIGRA